MEGLERRVIGLLLFFYLSGLVAHLWPAIAPINKYITDAFLLFANGLVLYMVYRRNRDRRLWFWLAAAYVFTFATEAIGVATGAVFGSYHYGPTMWWQALGVPFVIALNWCVLTLGANQFVGRWLDSVLLASLLAGITLALYDIPIEPVAIALDYWQWEAGVPPVRNYLAWAVVGAVISFPLRWLGIRYASPVLAVYFWVQLGFFLVLWGALAIR